ncbi:hypothetical protein AB1Y20_017166 [Prymnesium parvum]
MRYRFEGADAAGSYVDDCQFYLVPTGADAGAAVVLCRASPPAASPLAAARSRRRLREVRRLLGWTARASGQGDAFQSFRVLEQMFGAAPLAQKGEPLDEEQLRALRALANEGGGALSLL